MRRRRLRRAAAAGEKMAMAARRSNRCVGARRMAEEVSHENARGNNGARKRMPVRRRCVICREITMRSVVAKCSVARERERFVKWRATGACAFIDPNYDRSLINDRFITDARVIDRLFKNIGRRYADSAITRGACVIDELTAAAALPVTSEPRRACAANRRR